MEQLKVGLAFLEYYGSLLCLFDVNKKTDGQSHENLNRRQSGCGCWSEEGFDRKRQTAAHYPMIMNDDDVAALRGRIKT